MVEVMRNVSLCCHTNYTKWTKSFWRTRKVTEKKTRSFSHTDRKGEAAAATPWEHVSAKCLLSQWQDDFTLSSGLMVSTLLLPIGTFCTVLFYSARTTFCSLLYSCGDVSCLHASRICIVSIAAHPCAVWYVFTHTNIVLSVSRLLNTITQ